MSSNNGGLVPAAVAVFALLLAVFGGAGYATYEFGSSWQGGLFALGLIGLLIGGILGLRKFFTKYSGRIVFAVWLVAVLGSYFVYLFQTGRYPMGIDLAGGSELIYELDFTESRKQLEAMQKEAADISKTQPNTQKALEATRAWEAFQASINSASENAADVVRRRVDPTGTKGIPVTTFDNKNKLRIMLPRATNEEVQRVRDAVDKQGNLSFHIVETKSHILEEVLKSPTGLDKTGIYQKMEMKTPKKFSTKANDFTTEDLVVKRAPELKSPKIVHARHRLSQESGINYEIIVTFTSAGQTEFGQLTAKHKNERLAIVLDGVAHSAPTIKDAIYGECVISGSFSEKEAQELARILQSGSLPAKVVFVNQFTVGPGLGEEQIESGMTATLIGSVIVIGFILAYYRLAGAIAAFCTLLNVLMLLGAMGFFKATLTLPGIAGIVLTLGMSVDANVLILERLREELARGRPLRLAVTQGFDKAVLTIIDCNLTTLISGIVLYYMGTGPVRGFAVSLSIGILTTLFCNLWLNWIITEWLVSRDAIARLNFMQFFKETKIDFMGMRKTWIASSLFLMAASAVLVVAFHKNSFDVDFTGGTLMQFNFAPGKEKSSSEIKKLVEEEIEKAVVAKSTAQLQALGQSDLGLVAQTFGEANDKGLYRSFTVTTRITSNEVVDALSAQIGSTFKDSLDAEAISVDGNTLHLRLDADGTKKPEEVKARVLAARQAALNQPANQGIIKELNDLQVSGPETKDGQTFLTLAPLPQLEQQRKQLVEAVSSWAIDGRAPGALSRRVTFGAAVAQGLLISSVLALMVANLAVFVYVWFRFGFSSGWGFGAIVALIHDSLIAAGGVVLAHLLGMNILVDLNTVAALLTIIGFSVNDTIVVFDRIREVKTAHPTRPLQDIVNEAVNAMLPRTILTSATVIMATLALFVFGGETIRGMAWTLLVGFTVGVYSSVFIAAPLMIWWYDKFGMGRIPVPATTKAKSDAPQGAEI